jgi:hypothetical protein
MVFAEKLRSFFSKFGPIEDAVSGPGSSVMLMMIINLQS